MASNVDDQFKQLSSNIVECQKYIDRLSRVDSTRVLQELCEQIRRSIEHAERQVKRIEFEAQQQDDESTENQILRRAETHTVKLAVLKKSWQEKQRQAKDRIQRQERAKREELFSFAGKRNDATSYAETYELKQRKKQGGDDSLLRTSNKVTESLRQVLAQAQEEVEKSHQTSASLADSTRTLMATRSEYIELGSFLDVSKRLVRQLEASDWFDRISIILALAFFCLVVLYIIKKRTWDVGISWVAWISNKGRLPPLPNQALTTLATYTGLVQPTASQIPSAALTTATPATLVEQASESVLTLVSDSF